MWGMCERSQSSPSLRRKGFHTANQREWVFISMVDQCSLATKKVTTSSSGKTGDLHPKHGTWCQQFPKPAFLCQWKSLEQARSTSSSLQRSFVSISLFHGICFADLKSSSHSFLSRCPPITSCAVFPSVTDFHLLGNLGT